MFLKIRKIHKDAKLPFFSHNSDAGMDICTPERITLRPGERKTIGLGIAIEIPDGYVGLMWDKSGLSHKYGIKTFGGVIDAGYTGEIHAGIMNLSKETYVFEKGHKVIQLLIQKIEHPTIIEVKELKKSTRDKNGFGSTGK